MLAILAIESRIFAFQIRELWRNTMDSGNTKLRIVRLIEPSLCLSCKFAAIATVEMDNGSNRKMMHCKRLDCDNWQTEESDHQPLTIFDSDEGES